MFLFCVDLDGRYELKNKINNIQTVMQNVHCSIDYNVHFTAYNVKYFSCLSVCIQKLSKQQKFEPIGPTCLGHHVIPGKV